MVINSYIKSQSVGIILVSST